MKLLLSLKGRPILTILVIAMLGVGLACAGGKATPTSPPTATLAPTATTAPTATLVPTATATLVPGAPTATATAVPTATATAVPTPTVDIATLPWPERYMRSAGYKPAWGEPQYGGIFRASLGIETINLSPQTGAGAWDMPARASLYNTLVRVDPWISADVIIGDLAKSWSVSGDGLQITFQLEEGVKFHDNPYIPERLRNADFTCEDVQASLERWIRPPKAADFLTSGPVNLNHINSISCPDGPLGYTAALHLDLPLAKTLRYLTASGLAMLDKEYIEWLHAEHPGKLDVTTSNYRLVTATGPMVPLEFTKDVVSKMRRNPNYFREGLPFLDGIDSFIIKDAVTRLTALVTGQVNLYGHGSISSIPVEINQMVRDFPTRLVVNSAVYSLGYGVWYNTQRPPFNDWRVRKAVHIAVDRKAYIDFNTAGPYTGRILYGFIGPRSYFTTPMEELMTWPGYRQPKDQDIAEANRLLDEVFGKGKRFTTDCMARNQQAQMDFCLFFGDQLKKSLNVNLAMDFNEIAVHQTKSLMCGFGMISGTVGSMAFGDPDDTFLAHDRTRVTRTQGYVCPIDDPANAEKQAELEALMAAQSRELDPVKRRELVWALDKKLVNDDDIHYQSSLGWIVVFYPTTPNVKGFYLIDINMSVYGTLYERVWLAK